jgi:type II secretory pathway pseudopilin PulG
VITRNSHPANVHCWRGDRTGGSGFSLVETMLALFIMTIVVGVAVDGLITMQRRSTAEMEKTDTVQETRDFIDQVVRDVHDAGYPPTTVFNQGPALGCTNNTNISCGITSFSSTQVVYEGDLDGTGTIYQVYLQLALNPGQTSCPCKLQRGVVRKQNPPVAPTYFTEVDGVLNSGDGAGGTTYGISLTGPGSYTNYASADVFKAWDQSAGPVANCVDVTSCSSIRNLQITVNVAPRYADPTTKVYRVYSITSKAQLNNSNNT